MAEYELKNQWGDLYAPLPTQLRFHQSRAKYKSYVGPFGAGKSLCGGMEALLKAIEKPGHRPGTTLIGRMTQTQLLDTTWKTFRELVRQTCPAMIKDERLSTQQIDLTLKNGWRFLGKGMHNFQDFGSLELDNFFLDEINDDGWDERAYLMLCGRLRGQVGDLTGWCAGNPGGRNWVYQRFFKHQVEGGRGTADHEGFHITDPMENIYLPEDYIDNLRSIYPEEWIERYLQGSFDIFEGQIFDNLDYSLHTVEPFKVPDEWPRYFGLDHGWTHPTAGIWAAMDFDGNLYVYREYYKSCAVPASNVANMLEMERVAGETEGMIQWRVIDPSTRQTQTAGGISQRIEDQYREAGMHCQLGDNDVKASIAQIKMLMQPDPAHLFPRCHPLAGEYNAPKLYISRDCKALLHEMGQYQWKAVKPGGRDRETPLAKSDDAIAALRYLVMRAPRAPVVKPRDPHQWLKAALSELETRNAGRELESPRNLIGA